MTAEHQDMHAYMYVFAHASLWLCVDTGKVCMDGRKLSRKQDNEGTILYISHASLSVDVSLGGALAMYALQI